MKLLIFSSQSSNYQTPSILLITLLFGFTYLISPQLKFCNQIAEDYFLNTCSDAPEKPAHSVLKMEGDQVKCKHNPPSCPGENWSDGKQICKWKRKLCVTCRQQSQNKPVYIRVQSNGLPNHCFASHKPPKEQNIDFEVIFNSYSALNHDAKKDTKPNLNLEVQGQSELNQTICAPLWTKNVNIPSQCNFNLLNQSDPVNIISGVSINGVPFMPALNLHHEDIFNHFNDIDDSYIKDSEIEEIDKCLGRVNMSGKYVYSTISPCFKEIQYGEKYQVCSRKNGCDFKEQMIKQQKKELRVVGIAKDGNLIVGPYNQKEKIWGRDGIDVCSGTVLNKKEYEESFEVKKMKSQVMYVYISRTTFPYLNGCYGPANQPEFLAECSKNASSSSRTAASLVRHIH